MFEPREVHACPRKQNKSGLLTSLAKDGRGSTISIVAAAMIPLVGMIGSGVDLSRAYLAKTRLQQACDAGVLAGRKVMAGNVNDTVRNEVRKFVNFNFKQGTLGTAAFAIDPVEGLGESIDLTLTTTVPTALMKIFGFTSFPISVSCTARQDFVNTDVMLVLDTTLSMNCLASEPASTYCPTEKTSAKIVSLRSAVNALYAALKPAQDQLEDNDLRLRYGIVPYSMTVNVGRLLTETNPSWIRSPASYKTCTNGNSDTCTTATTISKNHDASTWGGCIEERQTINSINALSGYTSPSGALDLDINSAPTGDPATQWAAYDPAAVTAKRGYPGIDHACPKQARKFARFATASDLSSWLTNGFTAGGYTYHDLGLIWGMRLMSSTGLWGAENPTVFNNFPVNKHLIFMTDGFLDPDIQAYTAYGVEKFDRRVGDGTEATAQTSHIQRFRMMCNKIKGDNITLWVVAFGTSAGTAVTPELRNCASSANHASHSSNQAALVERFQQIGQDIGALRLSR